MNVTERLRDYLKQHEVQYKELSHPPSETCEISAKNRGEDIKIGGKCLLFKDKHDFRLFVISASRQVDSKKVRKILKSSKLRFATHEELMEHCGVVSGALPPFGKTFFPFDLFIDESIFENEKIAFNAGDLSISFILDINDYKKVVSPTICSFGRD